MKVWRPVKLVNTMLKDVGHGIPVQFKEGLEGTWIVTPERDHTHEEAKCFNVETCELRWVSIWKHCEHFPGAALNLEPSTNSDTYLMLKSVAGYMAEGRKIQAIKEVRAAIGLGLKEAKELVDALEGHKLSQLAKQREEFTARIERLQDEIASLRAAGYGNPDTLDLEGCAFKTEEDVFPETYTLGGLIMVLVERARNGAPLDTPVVFDETEGPETITDHRLEERKLVRDHEGLTELKRSPDVSGKLVLTLS